MSSRTLLRANEIYTLLLGLAGTVLLLVTTPWSSAAADPPPIQIYVEAGGPSTDTITLTLPLDESSVSRRLYLMAAAPMEGVLLTATLRDANDQILPDAELAILAGPDEETAGPLVITPTTRLPILLRVGGITTAGRFSGTLTWRHAGDITSQQLARLIIVRPRIELPVPAGTGTLDLVTRSREFSFTIPLLSEDIEAPTVELGLFSRSDGTQGTAQIQPPALTPDPADAIQAGGERHWVIHLTGYLPDQATYSTTLYLRVGAVRRGYPLTLRHDVAITPTIEVDEITAAAMIRGPDLFGSTPEQAELSIVIRPLGAEETTIYVPELSSFQTHYGLRVVSAATQKPQLFLRAADGDHEITFPPVSSPARSQTLPTAVLPPNRSTTYIYRITGLAPGVYQGTAMIASPVGPPVVREFTILAKDGCILPLLTIILGVFGASLLRYAAGPLRLWLRRRRELAEVRRGVENVASPVGPLNRVQDELSHQITDLETTPTQEGFTPRLVDIRARLRLYRTTLDRRLVIDKMLTKIGEQASSTATLTQRRSEFRKELHTTLEGISKALTDATPASLADASNLVATLYTLQEKIVVSTVTVPAHDLKTLVVNFQTENPARHDAVAPILAGIESLQEDDLINASQVTDLERKLTTAKHDFIRVLLEDLEERVDYLEHMREETRIGSGVASADVWATVDAQLSTVRVALNTASQSLAGSDESAIDTSWMEARSAYLQAQIAHLSVLASNGAQPDGLSEQVWGALLQTTPRLNELVKAARQARSYETAVVAFQQAENRYFQLRNEVLRKAITDYQVFAPITNSSTIPEEFKGLLREALSAPLQAIQAELQTPAAQVPDATEERSIYYDTQFRWAAVRLAVLERIVARLPALYPPADPADAPDPAIAALQSERLRPARHALDDTQQQGWLRERQLRKAIRDISTAEIELGALIGRQPEAPLSIATAGAGGSPISISDSPELTPPLFTPSVELPELPEILTAAIEALIRNTPPTEPHQETPQARTARLRKEARHWTRSILIVEGGAFIVGILLASSIGLITLYWPNPTFGTPQDYLTAFLWGFSLQQVTGLVKDATGTGSEAATV